MSVGEKPDLGVVPRPRPFDVRRFVTDLISTHAVAMKFMAMGTVGYVIYQFVVAIMYDTPILWFLPEKGHPVNLLLFEHGDGRLLAATLVATELSIMGVFTGHSRWTFRDRDAVKKPWWMLFGQFNAKALVSTLGILTVTVNVLTVRFDVYHYLAVPVGVALAFAWNWTWDTQIVWRRAKRPQPAP